MIPASHPIAAFGDIFLPHGRTSNKELLRDRGLELTYNGRGAILRACREIASRGKRNILVPAYHCPSGITPAILAGLQPVFYRVRRDLSVDFDDLLAKADGDTAAVLVIHYFGVATNLLPLQQLRLGGVSVIEDWSHSFLELLPLRLAGGDSDYRIYSFWKLVPTVVGGGLWRRDGEDRGVRFPSPASPWTERVVRLKRMIEEALTHSNYERVKVLYEWIEAIRLVGRGPSVESQPNTNQQVCGESRYPFDVTLANSRMPGLARSMLQSYDLPALAHKRRDNFALYGQFLNGSSQLKILYPTLPSRTCPWVFPVLLNRRNEIDHQWRSAGVALHTFGIYLHSALFENTDATTIEDALFLANNLLCLAIHQNLGAECIERSATTINHHLMSIDKSS